MPLKRTDKRYFDYFYSSYAYTGFIRKMILDFKFSNKKYLYDFLSFKMVKAIKEFDVFKIDFILYVPISFHRYLERGYNQSYLIAKQISNKTKIPLVKFCLVKIKNNKRQSELSVSDRMKNIDGVFKTIFDDIIKDKNILLIDDIYTTGATANECCRILKKAGAKKILLATVAIAQ